MQFTTNNYTIHNTLEKFAFFYDIMIGGPSKLACEGAIRA